MLLIFMFLPFIYGFIEIKILNINLIKKFNAFIVPSVLQANLILFVLPLLMWVGKGRWDGVIAV